LRGVKGSLVTDGASFKRSKGVAIMFASNGLSEPVLLKLVHPDDLGVYDHKKMALDVRAALVQFGMNIDQVFALLLVCCGWGFLIEASSNVRHIYRWPAPWGTMSPSTSHWPASSTFRWASAWPTPST
jgi:hypothetical protein